jgi:hypothetical protein
VGGKEKSDDPTPAATIVKDYGVPAGVTPVSLTSVPDEEKKAIAFGECG